MTISTQSGSVALVAMPWSVVRAPSIQIGTVHAVLERAGISCHSHSLFLEFVDFVNRKRGHDDVISIEDYQQVSEQSSLTGLGDWIFAVPPYREFDADGDKRYLDWLETQMPQPADALERVMQTRALVPAFLAHCADEILATDARVVGFTTAFSQNVPSLALAKLLKTRQPDIKIVFGGANCEGPMGVALHRAFTFIDVVARGEAEHSAPPLMRALLAGDPVPELPGLCWRKSCGESVVIEEARGPQVDMRAVPPPNYDDYFSRMEAASVGGDIASDVAVWFESSRGCWWGAKAHCTFCGMNGATMDYRSKPADQVHDELVGLAAKYGFLNMNCVDNILDMSYFETLLPRLRDGGCDFSLFYETKANLSQAQVKLLADAGVRHIQPGIESLSTPILKLMRKGVSAMQNIQLLKWCSQYDVNPTWGIIYGFPGETYEQYEQMATFLPALVHFTPPYLFSLRMDRFSPYYQNPRGMGLERVGARAAYRFLYDVDDQTLEQLAYFFEFRYQEPQDVERVRQLMQPLVDHWKENHGANVGALTYRRGPGLLVIEDDRTTTEDARYTLQALETEVYLACETAARPDTILRKVQHNFPSATLERIQGVLDDFLEAKLMYQEAGRYLGLAIARFGARNQEPISSGKTALTIAPG